MNARCSSSTTGPGSAYRDVRRFGTWLVVEGAELEPYLAGKNGPEPLSPRFTAAWLGSRLAVRRAAVKAVLLDQRVVAGLGNIYADEALWRARVNPLRPAQDLDADEVGGCTARSGQRFGRESSSRDRRSPSTERRTEGAAGCRTSFGCMDATACRASLRHDDNEDASRRPGHLVLPTLPAIGLAAGRTA